MKKKDTIKINNEIFKVIPEHSSYYASQKGEIYSTKSKKILKSHKLGCFSYYISILSINNKRKNVPTHKLVALTWCELPEGYTINDVINNWKSHSLVVDHINGDKFDNRASNLRWCTPYENWHADNWDKESLKGNLKGNQNAKGRKKSSVSATRYVYVYKNWAYTLGELCQKLNCTKSCITEAFRRNIGLVRSGELTRYDLDKIEIKDDGSVWYNENL